MTKVTFSFWSKAFFKLVFACLRKAPSEFLGIAMADEKVYMSPGRVIEGASGNRVACDVIDDGDCGVTSG